jgi:hypothetical protein
LWLSSIVNLQKRSIIHKTNRKQAENTYFPSGLRMINCIVQQSNGNSNG